MTRRESSPARQTVKKIGEEFIPHVDLSEEGPGKKTQPKLTEDPHLKHKYVPLMQGESAPFDVRFARPYQDYQPDGNRPFEPRFAWAAALAHSPELREEYMAHRTEFRTAMGNILQLLDITDVRQIPGAFDEKGKAAKIIDINRAIGRLYSPHVEGKRSTKDSRKAKTVEYYAKSADTFISGLRLNDGILNPIAWKIRPSEEAISRSNPYELLELAFTPGNSPKLGFEALRKLFLGTKIAAVDTVSAELEEGDTYRRFTDLLDKLVWDQEHPKGYTEDVVLLSKHDMETYDVLYELEDGSLVTFDKIPKGQIETAKPAISEVPATQKDAVEAAVRKSDPDLTGHHLRLTTLQSRLFKHNGVSHHAFVDKRQKKFHSWVMKMLRKGEDEPTVAVEDRIGMMLVVKDAEEADMLVEQLQMAGRRTGSILLPEGIEDNLKRRGKSRKYSAKNTGSSSDTEMMKFYARVHGMRIEVIIHTRESYLNYQFSDKTGHDDFEIRRFFDSGLYALLFPRSIYPEADPKEDREYLLEEKRRAKRTQRIG